MATPGDTGEASSIRMRSSKETDGACSDDGSNWTRITRQSDKLSPEQKQRLDAFVAAGYNAAKLQDSESDVKEHKDHVENIVKTIARQLGDCFSSLKIKGTLGTGSFYRNERILNANEFDYLLILELSNQVHVEMINTNMNKVEINVMNESLRQDIKNNLSKYSMQEFHILLTNDNLLHFDPFRYVLINTIHECLEQLKRDGVVNYKGKHKLNCSVDTLHALHTLRRLRDGTDNEAHRDAYNILLQKSENKQSHDVSNIPELAGFDVILDAQMHGPAIRLRMHGPLGDTDIDLGFCIESSRSETGLYIILPMSYGWLYSFYESPCSPRLDLHHKKILIFIKYVFIECNFVSHSTLNSHQLKTFVLVHQDRCKQKHRDADRSLGGCFTDIAFYMFENTDMKISNKGNISYHGIFNSFLLPDINFPNRTVDVDISPESLLLLYILIEVVKNVDTPSAEHRAIEAIDHRLVLAEILAPKNVLRRYILAQQFHKNNIFLKLLCDSKLLEEMKHKSNTAFRVG